jgi:hypothetical protein
MTENTAARALGEIITALEPLSTDQRERVLRAAAAYLEGSEPVKRGRPRGSKNKTQESLLSEERV